MRVEQEGRDAHREDGHPEVRHPARPNGKRHIEQHDERAHAQVDTRAREPGVEDRKRDARRCEATTSGNVPRTTKGQVGDDRVRRDLSREDLERRRQRAEMLRETDDSLDGATLDELCQKI